jgi:hypothetical protein
VCSDCDLNKPPPRTSLPSQSRWLASTNPVLIGSIGTSRDVHVGSGGRNGERLSLAPDAQRRYQFADRETLVTLRHTRRSSSGGSTGTSPPACLDPDHHGLTTPRASWGPWRQLERLDGSSRRPEEAGRGSSTIRDTARAHLEPNGGRIRTREAYTALSPTRQIGVGHQIRCLAASSFETHPLPSDSTPRHETTSRKRPPNKSRGGRPPAVRGRSVTGTGGANYTPARTTIRRAGRRSGTCGNTAPTAWPRSRAVLVGDPERPPTSSVKVLSPSSDARGADRIARKGKWRRRCRRKAPSAVVEAANLSRISPAGRRRDGRR